MFWKQKLKAFLEGLEIENINGLMKDADVTAYKALGQICAKHIKVLKDANELYRHKNDPHTTSPSN